MELFKVLAINSSPFKGKSNTSLILNPFIEGLESEGANTELIYTEDLNIKPCKGEMSCMLRSGECIQDDDMNLVRQKMRESNVLVLASPLYCDGVTGPMKNVLDRTITEILPFMEIKEDRSIHPSRYDVEGSKIVLVSNCGFWEKENFNPMVAHIQAFSRNSHSEFAGALLRPHGPALRNMIEMDQPVDDVLYAARDAGRQLARDGKISPETLNTVSRELLPRDFYLQIVNQHFKDELKSLENK